MRIAKHNRLAEAGNKTYFLAMNRFGDQLNHEFSALRNGFKVSAKFGSRDGSTFLSPSNVVVPNSVDWRKKGYVTEVKDQGQFYLILYVPNNFK